MLVRKVRVLKEKIQKAAPKAGSMCFLLPLGVLLRSPAFGFLVRSLPGKRKESAAMQAISGVGGMAAGVVCCGPSGSSSSVIAFLRWSASPTVGNFLEIILSALQGCLLRNSLSASPVT